MSAYSRISLQLTALCLILTAVSFAADASSADASLYVVHGIPGRDVAADVNPALPVDLLLNDDVCSFRGLTFPGTSGPLTLPAGNYDIKISPANSLLPCSNPAEAETTVKLSAGGAATVALALSNGSPTLFTFTDNLKTVPVNEGRITIANATDAGTLQVTLTQPIVKKPKIQKFTIAAGSEATVELPVGPYLLQATAGGGMTPLVNGVVTAENQSVELVYIVGSSTNNAVTLLSRLIRDVF
jgi:uncharacterized protein DUF4397